MLASIKVANLLFPVAQPTPGVPTPAWLQRIAEPINRYGAALYFSRDIVGVSSVLGLAVALKVSPPQGPHQGAPRWCQHPAHSHFSVKGTPDWSCRVVLAQGRSEMPCWQTAYCQCNYVLHFSCWLKRIRLLRSDSLPFISE